MPRSREEIMKDINYDESRIPACTLPSPLDRKDGGRIATAYEWVNRRRPEVLALYQKEVYGQITLLTAPQSGKRSVSTLPWTMERAIPL